MLVTLKLVEDVTDARNAARVLQQRRKYAEWFLEHGVLADFVFFTDECV